MGAHILYDKNIDRSVEPCGLRLRPSPMCIFYLKRSFGMVSDIQVDQTKSVCVNKVSFKYKIAVTSTSTSPCSNAPVICPECPLKAPAVWKYNMPSHMEKKHPHALQNALGEEWAISDLQMNLMKIIYGHSDIRRRRVPQSNRASKGYKFWKLIARLWH